MAGKSPVRMSEAQGLALQLLAQSADRREADRARAILLTREGWTSADLAAVFGVREDMVRFWRAEFMRDGIDAVKASRAPGAPPVKAEAVDRVVTPLLEAPVADRPNWTIPRLAAEVWRRERITVSRSTLSKVLRKKTSAGGGPGTR
jgi:transposase